MSCSDPILTTGKRHPIFTRVFARVGPAMDTQGALEHRRALLAGLAGRVLEVGAGNGLNFAHYPPAVTELLAVEPEPYLRALAETAAHQAAIPIRVSTAPPMPCPVPMPAWTPPSHRWCCARCPTKPAPWLNSAGCYAPGGELRFFEHIQADTSGLARAPRLADIIWPTLVGGYHASRDTLTAITTAGFQLISTRRFRFPTAGCRRQPRRTCSGSPAAHPNPDRRGAIAPTNSLQHQP